VTASGVNQIVKLPPYPTIPARPNKTKRNAQFSFCFALWRQDTNSVELFRSLLQASPGWRALGSFRGGGSVRALEFPEPSLQLLLQRLLAGWLGQGRQFVMTSPKMVLFVFRPWGNLHHGDSFRKASTLFDLQLKVHASRETGPLS
jgi:hypothetical protein